MALKDLLSTIQRGDLREVDTTEQSVARYEDKLRKLISYWRLYPDRLIDFFCSLNPHNTFRLYFFQRFYLRVCFRYKDVYATFTRGFSKSFLAVLSLMLKAILYPGAKLFVSSDVKAQSAKILNDKISEICRLIPAMESEIIWDTRGSSAKTQVSKDQVSYQFKNGSTIENVAASESSRGRRYQSGLIEEAAQIDGKILNEVLMPMMNVERHVNGKVDPNEKLNKSTIFITSAGYKATFAYEKLIQMYCQMVVSPKEAFVFGGDYRISVAEGLMNLDDIKKTQADTTYDESSFEREFASLWAGSVEGSFFDPDTFDKYRTIERPNLKYDNRISQGSYFVMGVDVGRIGCTTEVVVMRVTPSSKDGKTQHKYVENILTFEAEHFGLQALHLKRIFERYHCKACVLDGNGLGIGLVDFLVTDQSDPDTGETLYNWGVINDDPDNPQYRKFMTDDTVHDALYIVKMNRESNSELYAYVQSQLTSGKVRFPKPSQEAESDMQALATYKDMSRREREERIMPFRQTDFLKNQMLNLVREDDLGAIVLKQANKRVKKDKFSAFIYAMLWPKMEEDRVSRKRGGLGDFVFFTPAGHNGNSALW